MDNNINVSFGFGEDYHLVQTNHSMTVYSKKNGSLGKASEPIPMRNIRVSADFKEDGNVAYTLSENGEPLSYAGLDEHAQSVILGVIDSHSENVRNGIKN